MMNMLLYKNTFAKTRNLVLWFVALAVCASSGGPALALENLAVCVFVTTLVTSKGKLFYW